MKLTKVDWREINTYKPTKLGELIDEFVEMNTEVVEVTEYDNVSATSCYNSLRSAIRRNNTHGVEVKVVKGKVYLLNRDLLDKHKED